MVLQIMTFHLQAILIAVSVTQAYSGGETISNGSNLLVTGSLLNFCGSPVLYSPVLPPIPMKVASQDSRFWLSEWQTDWSTDCLEGRAEMVAYCRRMFASTKDHITDVTLAPIAVPVNLTTTDVLSKEGNMSPKSKVLEFRPYWCLIGGQPSGRRAQPEQHQPLPLGKHNLTTIFDLHRTYFLRRFDQLSNRTEATVSSLVSHVIHAVEQLTRLPAVTSQQILLLSSSLLQSAHQQLKSVWSNSEAAWSQLEHQRHLTVTAELDSEDVAGQHEFTYVLQEPGATVDRLQTALSRLLSGLADSVHEEVFHLKAVLQHQPATLHLTADKTDAAASPHGSPRQVPAYITSLTSVHATLVKFVQQATVAINILRERMRTDMAKNTAARQVPHHYHYRPELVTNYNRLQQELTDARRILSLAQRQLLSDLAKDSRSLVAKLKAAAAAARNGSSVEAFDPWGVLVKHQDDLAYLDFMVGHVLTSFPRQPTSIGLDDQLLTWSRIWRPESGDLGAVTREQLTDHRNKFAVNFFFGFLLAFKAIALLLCIILGLLLICVTVHFTREHCRAKRSNRQLFVSLQHAAKHWLANALLGPSPKRNGWWRQRRFDQATATAASGPMEAGSGPKPMDNVHGYSNPACDNPKLVVVADK